MLRTIAYIIFLCTGIFAFSLIVLFFRSQGVETPQISQSNGQNITSQKTLDAIQKTYIFKNSPQKDIFGVSIFHFDVDIKTSDRIRMYVFHDDYATIKKNLSVLDNIYTFSEVDEPFWKVFFLNDKSTDKQIVRFVTDVDGTVLGFEVLKDEYNRLRALLSQ